MKINGYPKLSELVSSGYTKSTQGITKAQSAAQVNNAGIEKLAAMLGCKIEVVGIDDWYTIEKDPSTLYIVPRAESVSIYYGDLPLNNGGGGGLWVYLTALVANGLLGSAVTATEVLAE